MQGQITQTTLISGSVALWEQGRFAVAALVFMTTIVAPALEIGLLLYVLAPLHFGRALPGAVIAFREVERFRPWSMMEVFLIGIFVAVVKLADMADIVPGIALWAFGLLIPTLAGAAELRRVRPSARPLAPPGAPAQGVQQTLEPRRLLLVLPPIQLLLVLRRLLLQ